MKKFTILSLGALVAGLVLSTVDVTAQGRAQRGGFGGGNFDPELMRQRMAQMMKERLSATDEEWKVIEPRLMTVQEKQRANMGGRFGGMMGAFGGRGRGADRQGGDRPDRPQRPGMEEIQALREALEASDTPVSELKAKMKAVRELRKKNEAELKEAREKLREVLTTRQEATCLMMGLLD